SWSGAPDAGADGGCRTGAQPPRGSGRVPRGLGDPLPPTTAAARPPPASVESRDRVEVFAGMLREWPAFDALAKSFAKGEVCLRVAGLTGAARALVVAELLQIHPRPALVVVAGMADAHRWTQDLKLFGTPALEFSSPEPRLW